LRAWPWDTDCCDGDDVMTAVMLTQFSHLMYICFLPLLGLAGILIAVMLTPVVLAAVVSIAVELTAVLSVVVLSTVVLTAVLSVVVLSAVVLAAVLSVVVLSREHSQLRKLTTV